MASYPLMTTTWVPAQLHTLSVNAAQANNLPCWCPSRGQSHYRFIFVQDWGSRLRLQMIVSKPTIAFHSFQIFFNFLAMACFASVAAFQAKWHVGPCMCKHLFPFNSNWAFICSRIIGFCTLCLHRWHLSIRVYADGSRFIRKIWQASSHCSCAEGRTHRFYLHSYWCYIQPLDCVSHINATIYSFAKFTLQVYHYYISLDGTRMQKSSQRSSRSKRSWFPKRVAGLV